MFGVTLAEFVLISPLTAHLFPTLTIRRCIMALSLAVGFKRLLSLDYRT